MADRYLLESGAPDGYQLEDGSGVLLLEGTSPALDDGDVSWWAGVNLSGAVQIALAGAAIALTSSVSIANSFNHQDDPDRSPRAGATSPTVSPQRKVETTTFIRWATNDEIGTPAAAPLFEENESWIAPWPVVNTTIQPLVWINDDIVPQPPAVLGVDEEPQPVATAPLVAPVVTVFSEQDERPTPAASTFVEEESWLRFQLPAYDPTFMVWAVGDSAVAINVDEIYEWKPQTAIVLPVLWTWFADEQIVPTGSAPSIGGGLLHESVLVISWHQPDEFPQQAVTFPPEEGEYFPRSIEPQPVSLVWTHQDEIQRIQVEETDQWPQVIWPATTSLPFTDDDQIVPQPPATIQFDEEYVLTFQTPPAPVIWYPPVDEEFPELVAAVIVQTLEVTGGWPIHYGRINRQRKVSADVIIPRQHERVDRGTVLCLWGFEQEDWAEILPNVPQSLHEELASLARDVRGTEAERQLQELCRRISETRQITKAAVLEMWDGRLTDASSRLLKAIVSALALQALSPATAQTVATIEQIQSDLTRAQERLSKRKELRRLERKDQYVVGEIRRLLDEQDRLQLSVQALELQLRQAGMDNDDIALILALAS